MTELTLEQLRAIDITLDTAPKIQDDLKAKFGYGENKFFYLDLFEYRINNSLLDIAEDLDVKSLYGIESDKVADSSVGRAFRGHHNEEFMPDYQFNGLFSEEMNDMIEERRDSINGRKAYELGLGYHAQTSEEKSELGRKTYEQGIGIHALTPEERIGNGRIGGRKAYERGVGIHALTLEEKSELGRKTYEQGIGIHALTPEERIGNGRKGGRIGGRKGALASAEAQGFHVWSLEEIAEIGELKYGEGLSWNETTSEMNEKYGENYTTVQVKNAYYNNKHLLPDEEE